MSEIIALLTVLIPCLSEMSGEERDLAYRSGVMSSSRYSF